MAPIIQRELKIIARRPRTFRIRLLVTVIAFLWCVILVLSGPANRGGSYVFNMLTTIAFLACLIQSVRRAASCISDEKKEGTLGLLFLTDMRGRDIIFGKLISVSALSAHALLAFLPVLAMTLVIGGTQLSEVARAGLVLGTTLLFSMATGVFMSTISKESHASSIATLFTLLALTFVPTAIGKISATFEPIGYFGLSTLFIGISDPGYRMNAPQFWRSLLAVNAMTVISLLISSRLVRTVWQDKPMRQKAKKKSRFREGARRRESNKLLDRNPGEWLCMRHAIGVGQRLAFIVLILGSTAALLFAWVYSDNDVAASIGIGVLVVSALLLLIRVASQASFTLAELRESGAIELLLSTPLAPPKLITGHAWGMIRQFAPAIFAQLVASFALLLMSPWHEFGGILYGIASYLCAVASTAAFGMWMGLREKTANAAFLKTMIIGLLVPSIFCGCLTPIVAYPALFLIAVAQLTGKNLRRLLTKDAQWMWHRDNSSPVLPAPPVIPRQT